MRAIDKKTIAEAKADMKTFNKVSNLLERANHILNKTLIHGRCDKLRVLTQLAAEHASDAYYEAEYDADPKNLKSPLD